MTALKPQPPCGTPAGRTCDRHSPRRAQVSKAAHGLTRHPLTGGHPSPSGCYLSQSVRTSQTFTQTGILGSSLRVLKAPQAHQGQARDGCRGGLPQVCAFACSAGVRVAASEVVLGLQQNHVSRCQDVSIPPRRWPAMAGSWLDSAHFQSALCQCFPNTVRACACVRVCARTREGDSILGGVPRELEKSCFRHRRLFHFSSASTGL